MVSKAAGYHLTDIGDAQPGHSKVRAKMGYFLSSTELFE
jgi:hypothetical protein